MTNAQEFTSGTDPRNAASVLRVSEMAMAGSNVMLSFPTAAGKIYHLECSDSLLNGSWAVVQENIPGTGADIQVTDIGGANNARRFYRIVVAP